MATVFKQLIILLLIILAALGIYFGALLPLAKSQSFIKAQQNIQTVKSTDDLKALYDVPLKLYSPVGQEEVVKFTASTVSDIVFSQQLDDATVRWLVSYIEPYLFKNELRHLMLLGDMYRVVWERYGQKPEDFAKAETLYLEAYKIGPKLPPILYRLTESYLKAGDRDRARQFGEIILEYWDDPNVGAAIQ